MADTSNISRGTHPAPDPRESGNTVATAGPNVPFPPLQEVTVDGVTITGNGTAQLPLVATGGGPVGATLLAALATSHVGLGAQTLTGAVNIASFVVDSAGNYSVTLDAPPPDWGRVVACSGCSFAGPGQPMTANLSLPPAGDTTSTLLNVNCRLLDGTNADPIGFWATLWVVPAAVVAPHIEV